MPTNLSLDKIYQLVDEASQLDLFLGSQVFFVIFTGCTGEETCDLAWEDIHIDEQEVRLGEKEGRLSSDAAE